MSDDDDIEFDSAGSPNSDDFEGEFDDDDDEDEDDGIEFQDDDEDGEEDDFFSEKVEGEIKQKKVVNNNIIGERKGGDVMKNLKIRRKVYEVIHESKLSKSTEKDVVELQGILYVDFFSAKEILKFFKWNIEKTLNYFFANGKEKMFEETGLDTYLIFHEGEKNNEEFECPVCLDDVKMKEVISISKCNHRFCRNCVKNYFKLKLKSLRVFSSSVPIECPHRGCQTRFNSQIIQHFMRDNVKAANLELIKNYVSTNKYVTYCPYPNCKFVSKLNPNMIHSTERVIIECECNRSYCFGCKFKGNHFPARCIHVKDWNIKAEQETASMRWIDENSKDCPGCRVQIFKDGGCNMMHCGKCGVGFCWFCLSKNVNYGHSCIFRDGEGVGRENKNKDVVVKLDQTNYFSAFEKWKIMEKSVEFETQLYFSEDWLIDCAKSMSVARRIMMNSLVYYFYEFSIEIFEIERELSLLLKKMPKKRRKKMRKKNTKKKKNKGNLDRVTKSVFEKVEEIKERKNNVLTNKNLFTCYLQQLEENIERLAHFLEMNEEKLKKKRYNVENIKKIMDKLILTVEERLTFFEKERTLEKNEKNKKNK